MSSHARVSFAKNCEDIDQLLKIHTDIAGEGPGRRWKLEALHKSAIVLITAFWEAFCEDLAAESLKHLVTHAPSAEVLPVELRKQIAKELEGDKNNLAIWQLADEGWRSVLDRRLVRLQEQRNRRLNTPNTQQIDDLFCDSLGFKKISDSWYWRGMSKQRAATKLDEFLTIRHEVAHRGSAAFSIHKYDVNEYYNHISRLVDHTVAKISRFLTEATGVTPWPDESNA